MKILYAVQGTGNGHLTRARVMANAFANTSVEIDWVFSGRPKDKFFDMEAFGDYKVLRGMTFAIDHGRVNYLKTLFKNNLFVFFKEVKALNVKGYDLAIVDFEPVTGWATKLAGVDSLAISHQASFKYSIPKSGNNAFTDMFMNWFAPVKNSIGLHWSDFGAPILPPIIETHLVDENPEEDDFTLVYHPFMELSDVIELLTPLYHHNFKVYDDVPEVMQLGHIEVLPFSRKGFQQHLAHCSGVMCGAGFELPSEAIHQGKKLLVTPLKGQMEQQSNAKALEELGLGRVCNELNQECLTNWLAEPAIDHKEFSDVAAEIAKWVENGRVESVSDMSKRLWN